MVISSETGMHPNQVRGTLFRDFALRRYRAFMQERRELHALAARELRQSLADDQRLECVRLLVRRKSGIIGEQLIEEEDAVVRRGPVRPEQERTRRRAS